MHYACRERERESKEKLHEGEGWETGFGIKQKTHHVRIHHVPGP